MRVLILACVFIPLSLTSVRAEDLPLFNVRLFCETNSKGQVGTCERSEQAAKREMEVRWEAFPRQRKHFCVQSVSFQPRANRSYVALATCLADRAPIS